MIVIVGSRNDTFHFTGPNKTIFHTEDDPDNVYYNEMCGHRYILQNFDRFRNDPYVGLEHYRRAFDFSDAFIRELLSVYDIVVKPEHGPYGSDTNLSVLAHCSRHGLNYLEQAKEWVERFPELREQANPIKKSRAYYERHKDDPEFKARKQACWNAWKERNPERAREIREYSNAVQRGKMKQRRLGGEHVLALLGITLKVRMVA